MSKFQLEGIRVRLSTYLIRAGCMIGVALPLTAIMLATLEMTDQSAREEGFLSVLGGAFGMVYIWGMLTGVAVSIVHTAFVRRFTYGWLGSVVLGAVLGAAGGAVTPTLFTGLIHPATIAWATIAGIIYGALSNFISEPLGEASKMV